MRISKNIYEKYGVKPKKPYKYIFWRPIYDFNMLVNALETNILKKYKEYYKLDDERFNKLKEKALPLFQMFEYIKKPRVIYLIIQGKEQKMIGTFWKFIFSYVNKIQYKILNFAIDVGFSQKNAYGLGFVNVKK